MSRDLSLRKLRSFAMIAELGSFVRAAERLHVSPSALSSHMRELEETLGVPLLHRTTRSVRVTAEGTRFLAHVRQVIGDLDAVIDQLKDEGRLVRGRVKVACIPTLVSGTLPRVMTIFQERFPGISVSVLDVGAAEMAECIQNGKADLGIGPPPENSRDFEVEPLIEDEFVAVVPAGHPLAREPEVRFADLMRFPFITLKSSTSVRAALARAAADNGLPFAPAYELVHHYSVGSMVQAGLGVTALPYMAFSLMNLPGLTYVPLAAPRIARTIAVVRHRDGRLPPAAREFLSVLTETVERLSQTVFVKASSRRAALPRRVGPVPSHKPLRTARSRSPIEQN